LFTYYIRYPYPYTITHTQIYLPVPHPINNYCVLFQWVSKICRQLQTIQISVLRSTASVKPIHAYRLYIWCSQLNGSCSEPVQVIVIASVFVVKSTSTIRLCCWARVAYQFVSHFSAACSSASKTRFLRYLYYLLKHTLVSKRTHCSATTAVTETAVNYTTVSI